MFDGYTATQVQHGTFRITKRERNASKANAQETFLERRK